MSLERIRNPVETTTHPKLTQLLALLIEHRGLTVIAAAPLLDLPNFMVLRLANRLTRLGYATHMQGANCTGSTSRSTIPRPVVTPKTTSERLSVRRSAAWQS
jgi:hypothetical protein